jgi:hypothetical protein
MYYIGRVDMCVCVFRENMNTLQILKLSDCIW